MSMVEPKSRREFLANLGGGFGAVALSGLLAEDATATSPLAPKQPHHASKAKSVML